MTGTSVIILLLFGACSGGPAEDATSTTAPELPATDAAGAFTFSVAACIYEGPESQPEGELSFGLTSTAGQADFDLWRMDEGHAYTELVAHIAEEVRLGEEGLPGLGHPTFATLVAEATTDTEGRGTLTASLDAGVYGMACIRSGEEGAFVAAGPFTAGVDATG